MAQTKILVVDDDRSLLDLIHMRLQAEGYDVVAVNHEDKAKEVAVREIFEVAVIDLQLVKQDGLSLMDGHNSDGSWQHRKCGRGYAAGCLQLFDQTL